MPTLVTFHAHPDDEAIATGGTMALAAAAGHRVVLVTATRGEQGEPQPGVLRDGEPLWERRVEETHRSAEILGIHGVHFLGYEDSGMMGEPTNENPACFWQADVEEAAQRLAAILADVGCDVLTIYDGHGGYGHPDHIQVHRVGRRAAELVGVARVFQTTMNRDRIMQMMAEQRELAEEIAEDLAEDFDQRRDTIENGPFGMPEAEITHAVDVGAAIERKRAAMEAHASQISADSFFMKMPAEVFAVAFGTEWYVELDGSRADGAPFGTSLFDGLG